MHIRSVFDFRRRAKALAPILRLCRECFMSVRESFAEPEVFVLRQGLPRWINRYRRSDGELRFHARDYDRCAHASPTLIVEMSDVAGIVATYKCSLNLIDCDRGAWLVFSPLVIVWENGRKRTGAGLGRRMIDHCVSSIQGFCNLHVGEAGEIAGIALASGNLTAAKGGRAFFEGLGWEISAAGTSGGGDEGWKKALDFIAAQIDAVIAPFRGGADSVLDPTYFAVLRVSLAGPESSKCLPRTP
jgi:hypothetical protein